MQERVDEELTFGELPAKPIESPPDVSPREPIEPSRLGGAADAHIAVPIGEQPEQRQEW
jgi:hypothetical protein